MFNKFKYLILIIILIGVALPQIASAFLISESVAIFELILSGIEEKVSWMVAILIGTIFFYILGAFALWASMSILPFFIVHQLPWMQALKPMTTAGWTFTVGLANMLLIVIFVVIAFAFIFRIETLQAKKSLPKLIAVAFLMNFSLLFVNMAIDITHILYNTIINAVPGDFMDFWGTMNTIVTGPLWASATILIVLFTGLVVLFSIPYVNAISQVLFAALFIPVVLPLIGFLALQMMFFVPLAVMFITFTFLFAARVFILQLLAILAPLAFVSLILPQTKFFWSLWLRTLLQWLILGVFFLFLLVLGFSVLGLLVPTVSGIIDAGLPGPLSVFNPILNMVIMIIIFYFALFIYMAAITYVGKKFLPAGTEGIIGTVQGMGKWVMGAGVGFAAGRMVDWGRRRQAGQLEKRAETAKANKERYSGAKSMLLTQMGEKQRRGIEPTEEEKSALQKWTQREEKEGLIAERAEVKAKAMREQITAEQVKKLEGQTDAQLRQIISYEESKPSRGGPLTKVGPLAKNKAKIAAATDLLAKRGKITGAAERTISEAVEGGADANALMERRLDLAHLIKPGRFKELVKKETEQGIEQGVAEARAKQILIQEEGNKISPEDLRKKMQAETTANEAVTRYLIENESVREEFAKNARMELKRGVVTTMKNHPETFDAPEFVEIKLKMDEDARWPMELAELETKDAKKEEEELDY